MKMLSKADFMEEAGLPMPTGRDMSFYNGRSFDCACGQTHEFSSFRNFTNFITNGGNAKMIVVCPRNPDINTLIKTKYRFFVIFDRFISIAGSLR